MKRLFLIIANCMLCLYLVLAIVFLCRSNAEGQRKCSGLVVTLEKGVVEGSLTADGVKKMVIDDNFNPIGKQMKDINLRQLEEHLETKELIEKAECYATQDNIVHIDVKQRQPVMRVMDNEGGDYYVDDHGKAITPREYSCNLLVATGCISQGYANRVLAPIGTLILADDFWRSQIEQLNVLPDSTIEMIPRVGGHVVYLGQPVNIDNKLQRLRKFYKYGLSQVGWNKYSRISLELDNQIICKKKLKNK